MTPSKRRGLCLLVVVFATSLFAACGEGPRVELEWITSIDGDEGPGTPCGPNDTCTLTYTLVARTADGEVLETGFDDADGAFAGHLATTWGPCPSALQHLGVLCGSYGYDCGDRCYVTVLAVGVEGDVLRVTRHEDCSPGAACGFTNGEEVFSRPMGDWQLGPETVARQGAMRDAIEARKRVQEERTKERERARVFALAPLAVPAPKRWEPVQWAMVLRAERRLKPALRHMKGERWGKAAAALESILQTNPNFGRARHEAVCAHGLAGDLDGAFRNLSKLHAQGGWVAQKAIHELAERPCAPGLEGDPRWGNLTEGHAAPAPVYFDETAPSAHEFDFKIDEYHVASFHIWGRFFSDPSETICFMPDAGSFDEMEIPPETSRVFVLDCETGKRLATHWVVSKADRRKVDRARDLERDNLMRSLIEAAALWLHDMGAVEWPLLSEGKQDTLIEELDGSAIAGVEHGMLKSARSSPSGRYQALTITEMGDTDYEETIHFQIVRSDRDAQRRHVELSVHARKALSSCVWKQRQCDQGCDTYLGEGGRVGHGYLMCTAECEDNADACRKRAKAR